MIALPRWSSIRADPYDTPYYTLAGDIGREQNTCQTHFIGYIAVMVEASDFIAGSPALDFVNTVGGIRSGAHDEKLVTYTDILEWSVLAGDLAPAARAKLAAL